MKVLHLAAEGAPFAKTGGLGDVIASLPKALAQRGLEIAVMLPKYHEIPQQYKEQMVKRGEFTVPVGWRKQYCGLEVLEHQGVTYYFLDNEYYFKREGLYGHWDDGERYAYFCRAALEALPHLDVAPQIIHCHDWHGAMVPLLLQEHYGDSELYSRIKTVFSIHNLKYQGLFPTEILGDLLDLSHEKYFNWDGVEFWNQVSFMKAGVQFADMITTVSTTYSQEVQEPYYGERMDGILQEKSAAEKLKGIVNGIDYDEYNPQWDKHIFVNYTEKSLTKKSENKRRLQQCLGLEQNSTKPIIAIVSRLVEQKGIDLIMAVWDEVLATGAQVVILGSGDEDYENWFRTKGRENPHSVSVTISYNDQLARQIYAGADVFLMPSRFEPCGLGQLIALRYGTIPVVRATGGLKDTVEPYDETGDSGWGFTFANYNAHEMLFALEEAIAVYGKKSAWTKLRRRAMSQDFSWNNSAGEYLEVYTQLISKGESNV
ncbi:starch synthase [Desulfitispora alkaliphila]|uniref:glycogen synthase GlgA n=1 Tax=Desulfitispora alkaliphila TaxID=622674 RepID=UPI003D1BD68D